MAPLLFVAALMLSLDLSEELTDFRLFISKAPVTIRLSDDMPDVDDVVNQQCRKAHAYCNMWTHEIFLNAEFWRTGNKWQKRKVLYHEMGHCAVGLMHPDDPYEHTIMNSDLNEAKTDGSNWQQLFDELIVRSRRSSK